MTKEEYLKVYKEDTLAEICEQLEEERDYYHDEMNAYKSDAQSAQKRVDELSSYWKSTDRLFEKLKSIPAKDFIELYYQMKEVIENKATNKNTTYISDTNNWGGITTAISGR